jgi:hypothetical protein
MASLMNPIMMLYYPCCLHLQNGTHSENFVSTVNVHLIFSNRQPHVSGRNYADLNLTPALSFTQRNFQRRKLHEGAEKLGSGHGLLALKLQILQVIRHHTL